MSLEAHGLMELPGQLSKTDAAITVINYLIAKKQKRIDQYLNQVQMTEAQKLFIGEETDLIKNVNILIKSATKQIGERLGKLPPQSTDLEVTVLGAALLENPAFQTVRRFLKPEHFYIEAHKVIYQAALDIGDGPIDMRKVVEQLRRTGQIELIGGAYYIAELTSKVSSSANIEYHARIIIEMAIKRQVIFLCGQLLQDSYDDTTDCFELLESAEAVINQIRGWIK